jgi:hypothetical protein
MSERAGKPRLSLDHEPADRLAGLELVSQIGFGKGRSEAI